MIWAPIIIGVGVYLAYRQAKKKQVKQTEEGPIFGDGAAAGTALAPADPDAAKAQAVPDRLSFARGQLIESGQLLAVAGAGKLWFPPLLWLTTGVILFKARFLFLEAWYSIVKKKRPNALVVDSVFMGLTLLAGWYFVNAVLYGFYRLFNYIALKTEDHSRQKLVDVFAQQPRLVWVEQDGVEIEVSFDQLKDGDIIIVHAGDLSPVDGTVVHGVASVDQHLFTGESQLVEKVEGDAVYASTIVVSGRLKVRAEQTGAATLAAQIGKVLNENNSFAANVEARGMEIADRAALPMLGTAALAGVVSGLNGGITALTADFGASMRVLGPVAVLKHLEAASVNGLYVKDGRSLELLRTVDTLVFDKTGTLTLSEPVVERLLVWSDEAAEDQVLSWAGAAEQRLGHPIAVAIVKAARDRGLSLPQVDEKHFDIGFGVKVALPDGMIRVGSLRYMDLESIAVPDAARAAESEGHALGNSTVFVACDDRLVGSIELAPQLRPEASEVLSRLKRYCPHVCIISGDHDLPTRRLAERLGISEYYAEVLPHEKAEIVERLQTAGQKVCFIGDGINDSIALKASMVSVSFKGASSIASDSAQAVMMDDDLRALEVLFEVSRSLDRSMKTSYRVGIGATVATLGGLVLFGLGPAGGLLIANGARVGGLLNAMRSPRLPVDRRPKPAGTREAGPRGSAPAAAEPGEATAAALPAPPS